MSRHAFSAIAIAFGAGLPILVSCTNDGASPDDGGVTLIQNTGSDTMVNLAQSWAEAYKDVPGVSIEVSGGGSGVGISNLMQGTVDIANSSRAIKESEAAQVRTTTGKDAKEHIVGYDGIGIYVHNDNPIETLTLAQLGKMYGENPEITKWSQLGVDHTAFCASDEIVCFSRQSNSGTYVFFREAVLGKGDFRLGTKDMHGSKDVVDAVEHTPCGIGYSGMGYKTDGVKFVHIAAEEGAPAYEPTVENVLSKAYAIARPLYLYTIGEPTGHVKQYIDWIYSPIGQQIVADTGYVPLPKQN